MLEGSAFIRLKACRVSDFASHNSDKASKGLTGLCGQVFWQGCCHAFGWVRRLGQAANPPIVRAFETKKDSRRPQKHDETSLFMLLCRSYCFSGFSQVLSKLHQNTAPRVYIYIYIYLSLSLSLSFGRAMSEGEISLSLSLSKAKRAQSSRAARYGGSPRSLLRCLCHDSPNSS